jgi:hypothetical protein
MKDEILDVIFFSDVEGYLGASTGGAGSIFLGVTGLIVYNSFFKGTAAALIGYIDSTGLRIIYYYSGSVLMIN